MAGAGAGQQPDGEAPHELDADQVLDLPAEAGAQPDQEPEQ